MMSEVDIQPVAEIETQLEAPSLFEPIITTEENEALGTVNGCESSELTEVSEKFVEPIDNNQECDTSQDSIDKAETSSLDEGGKSEQSLPQTSESTDDSSTPKTSRELKSILALSKEAKLDTNISSHRRKTIDKVKGTPKRTKMTGFPVTAESELENFDVKIEEKKIAKKRKLSSGMDGSTEGATGDETRKSVQNVSGDFIMPRKPNKDVFCWRCHHDAVQVACETCPRAYHLRCLKQTITDAEHWPCPECVSILKAENTQSRSKAMRGMSLEHLCGLLKFAVKRMIQCNGSEPFIHPVDEKQFPEYRSYIIQPMTLTMLEKNIKENAYGSTQAFEADAKWILHNSIIFNSYQSKLTSAAKTIVKICKQEMAEIENCPSCYLNANTKKHTWFIEVCPKPHLLVWAKLKGFPYWPAKVMSVNSSGMADVRFFGAHDKAWVSVKDCYLYSVKDPNAGKQKRNDIIECVKELELYVDNLREIYGRVNFAPFKTPLEADSQLKQLQVFLPNFRNDGKEIMRKMKEIRMEKIEDVSEEEDDSTESSEEDEEEEEEEGDGGKRKSEEKSNGDKHKEGMTRIDYRQESEEKSKPTQKPPIKTILIRKRYSSEGSQENFVKVARREPNNESDTTRLSLDNSAKITESPDKNTVETEEQQQSSITSPKLRISDQLIKKLEDIKEKEVVNETEKTNDDDKGEIAESEASPVEKNDKEEVTETNVEQEKRDIENAKEEEVEIEQKKTEGTKKSGDTGESRQPAVIEDAKFEEPKETTDVQIDQTNICNVDHSPLTLPKQDLKKSDDKEKEKPKEKEKIAKKRKHTEEKHENRSTVREEETNTFPPHKMVKLVPIENILQKDLVETPPNKPDQLIVLKEIRVMKDGKEQKNKTKKQEGKVTPPVKIKSEVESDEDNNDVQYMEAKRQYLSALNISEKQKTPAKPKAHEIRTRSKTEEKKSRKEETPKPPGEPPKDSNVSKSVEPVKEIYIKSLSKMQTPKHKARKSFPTPNYGKKTIVARKIIPKPGMNEELTIVNATLQPSPNVMILPKLHYTQPINRDVSSPPVLTMLPRPQPEASNANKKIPEGSQNYIPQNENRNENSSNGAILLNNLLTSGTAQTPVIDVDSQTSSFDSDLGSLKEILPENLAKGVGEILCQPPPKLKPKPVGILNSVVESGVPSTAGPVASRINSMAQKLGDYFRSLLVETISDLGKSNNPEATISSLKYEIEELNHKHSIELAEIRRNVSIVLKDIQKSVVEERERIINETKANCEMEMMKRVEDAKSKEWCANCLKEAQFYCCWNTSYCDYPCQQKHWPKHMSKCTQTSGQNQSTTSPSRPPGQQLLLTPAAAPKFGTLFAKPQKVYLKRTNTPFKPTTGSHITLVESTPGNFELLGSGPIAVNGKILASTSVIEKIKSGNIVTVNAPSGAPVTQLTSANQRVNTATKSTANSSDSEH